MQNIYKLLIYICILMFAGCKHSEYVVSKVEGTMIPVDAHWDKHTKEFNKNIIPFKQKLDVEMNTIIGEATCDLFGSRPESPLSNLSAEVLRQAAAVQLGHPADLAVINMGGLRSSITKGPITIGNIFEIFPFDNTLGVFEIKGKDIITLFEEMAIRGGEGLSGASFTMTRKGKLVDCAIQGKPIEKEKVYTLASIDFLAEGNDGMPSFKKALKVTYPENCMLRELMLNYVKTETAQGRKISGQKDGRIKIVEK